ncbi:unnamed protein product [Scytosiphon promiscuus]
MTDLTGESDDEVEVLDLTTPLPPAPRSRLKTSTTTATSSATAAGRRASSSPSPSPTAAYISSSRAATDESGGASDGGVGGSSSDEDAFSMDCRPLRERLEASRAKAAGREGGQNVNGGAGLAGNKSSRSLPATAVPNAAAAAAATTRMVTSVLDSFSDDDEDDGIDAFFGCGSKGKGKARDCSAGSGAGGAVPAVSGGGDDEQEEADYAACTQESEVVDLLSDSDDDEGGAAPGRSQLWSRGGAGGGGPKAGGRAGGKGGAVATLGGSDGDSDQGIGEGRGPGSARGRNVFAEEEEEEGEEPEAEAAGRADSPPEIDLDSLVLASQSSSAAASSPCRPARGKARGVPLGVDRLGVAAAVPDSTIDSSDDDDFSMGGGGGVDAGSSSSTSRQAGGGGGGGRSGGGVRADAAALPRQEKALARKEATANRKRQRQEADAAAKQQRQEEKLARKREQDLAKQAEKAEKAAQKKREQQARGNFQQEEVACVIERRYFESARGASARAGAAEQPGCKEKFMVAAGDCGAPGAVWWTRRGYLEGGAAVSGPGVETLDMLAVVVPPETLLSRVERVSARGGGGGGSDGNLFPALGQFVDGIRAAAPGFSRLVLVLEGAKKALDQQWARSGRSSNGNGSAGGGCTRDDFEDAQCWLLIHKEVETRVTKDGEETGQYLWDLTKALSSSPYKAEVTELHCVSRTKTEARGSERFPEAEKVLMDTWVKMLEQVPQVSANKAVEIATHYPLPRDLVAALSDPAVPEAERASLLQEKMGGTRQQPLGALRIFQLFTQEDGDFVLP